MKQVLMALFVFAAVLTASAQSKAPAKQHQLGGASGVKRTDAKSSEMQQSLPQTGGVVQPQMGPAKTKATKKQKPINRQTKATKAKNKKALELKK